MEGSPTPTAAASFADVPDGAYYTDTVAWCAARGLVDGFGGGPNDPVIREQLVTILYRFAQYKDRDVSVGGGTNILSYADAFDVSEWAIPAMQWAYGAGIVHGGTDGWTQAAGPPAPSWPLCRQPSAGRPSRPVRRKWTFSKNDCPFRPEAWYNSREYKVSPARLRQGAGQPCRKGAHGMEPMESTSPFVPEFEHLVQFALDAVDGLRRFFLYAPEQGADAEILLAQPREGAEPEGLREELRTFFRDANALASLDGRFLTLRLRPEGREPLGAVCFERDGGAWTDTERTLLERFSAACAHALEAEQERWEVSGQNWAWSNMMDSTRAFLYVTDPETDEILFMNRAMKQAFRLEEPEGKICWKVLQRGQEARCPFCPVEKLSEHVISSFVWEEHNSITGRTYENYDSLMRWRDGRMVHFQHSTDVTETRRLYQAAMFDELTGAYSRMAGKEALTRLLDEYTAAKEPLCVCMLDINNLKQVNDLYGHAAGDTLLKRVAALVAGRLHGREFLMRLSGDEFVAVLPGVRQAAAAERMEQALSDFERERPEFSSPDAAFCYGMIEVREHMAVRDVLARADERMYQQKRALHIRRAEALMHGRAQQDCADLPFTYDTARLYDALLASTDSYVYVSNMKTGVFRYPPAMVAEFGLPGEIVPNAAAVWGAKVHPHDKRIFLESNQDIADGRTDVHCVEYRAQNVRGEWVWLRCRGHLERDENGEPALFAGFITNLGKKNKTDPLTGLFNKFELEDNVARILDASEPSPLAFLLLGLDEFKRINSLYDRAFGDEVIRITAQRLQPLMPPNAAVYRMDGDEFAVLLRGGGRDTAEHLFYRIRETFGGQQSFDGKKFYCTLSCGYAVAPDDGATYVDLVRCASYALDYAKRRGKNRIEGYADEMVADRRRALELTELLRESVERDFRGFRMFYQPVFSVSRELVGAEALARWSCEKYGEVGPGEFIPLLEQSGLILPVGRWILQEVLRTCARWEKRMAKFEMSVNLSYIQLEDEEFCRFMVETVEKTGVNPEHVILELTESYLAANMEQVARRLSGLRGRGLRMAMDDFGTGYSSLGVLKTAPIDIAKIDRAFVKDIQSSAFDAAFLRLVVELCGVLGIKTCLEGLENEDEFDAVRPMSLNYIQGFLLGRPMPEEEFQEKFLP